MRNGSVRSSRQSLRQRNHSKINHPAFVGGGAFTPEPLEGRMLLSGGAGGLGRAQNADNATLTDQTTVTAAAAPVDSTSTSSPTTQSLSTQSLTTQAVTTTTAVNVLPTMPTSDGWYGAIVNANNYITSYIDNTYVPPDVKLITDLTGTSADTYATSSAALAAQRPDTLVGTYHSSRDAQLAATMTNYPRRAVPREGLTSSQILMKEPSNANADIVNYTQTPARKYLISNVVSDVARTGSRLAYLDNVSHNEAGFPIAWSTTTSVVKDMVTQLHAQYRRVIVNAAWVPGVTSNTSVDQMIATGVDGVSFEMGFQASVRTDVTKIQTAMAQYRKMLDAGMTIVFIPLGSATGGADTIENIEIEARLQAGYGMMFRKPGDRLFTNELFYRATPEWATWPQTFGAPAAAATVTKDALGQVIMTRQFANGTLTVNVNTKEVTYTPVGTAAPATTAATTTAPASATTSTAPDTFSSTPITTSSTQSEPITTQILA
jgi:hypothetical protein